MSENRNEKKADYDVVAFLKCTENASILLYHSYNAISKITQEGIRRYALVNTPFNTATFSVEQPSGSCIMRNEPR